jgi:hypothetical protein
VTASTSHRENLTFLPAVYLNLSTCGKAAATPSQTRTTELLLETPNNTKQMDMFSLKPPPYYGKVAAN